jgi:hypothetical protein
LRNSVQREPWERKFERGWKRDEDWENRNLVKIWMSAGIDKKKISEIN